MSAEELEWESGPSPVSDDRLKGRMMEAFRRSPRYVRLVARMVRDDRVPVKAKVPLVIGGSYVVSPIDLIPGLIPVIGQIDDLVVIMAALGAATRFCPPELVDEHLAAVELTRDDMARDAETAQLAGKWAARKGLDAARSVAEQGVRLSAESIARGRELVAEWRAGR
jgi:uncharacterized membrane protein YkvA (DUF1232 family)